MSAVGDPVHDLGAKPKLRGQLHLYAAFVALICGVWLAARTRTPEITWAAIVYAVALVFMFSISALYHVPTWSAAKRLWLRRLDHCGIFLLIAGTATPLLASSLTGPDKSKALLTVWIGASIGLLQSLFWVKAPKALVAGLCILVGWISTPYVLQVTPVIGKTCLSLLVAGGVTYSLGALAYALKRPNFSPRYFGYHEVFHALVIVASVLHFIAIAMLVI